MENKIETFINSIMKSVEARASIGGDALKEIREVVEANINEAYNLGVSDGASK